MINDQVGFVLTISAAFLMVMGVVGVVLAASLSKRDSLAGKPPEAAKAHVEPIGEESVAARKAAYRRGVYVLIALVVLTVLEFLVALALNGSTVLLFVIILAKAGLILQYYMHMDQVWSEGEAH